MPTLKQLKALLPFIVILFVFVSTGILYTNDSTAGFMGLLFIVFFACCIGYYRITKIEAQFKELSHSHRSNLAKQSGYKSKEHDE